MAIHFFIIASILSFELSSSIISSKMFIMFSTRCFVNNIFIFVSKCFIIFCKSETLVYRFLRRSNRKLVVDILRTVVDEHGNSFLHYCILWWENNENPFIRFLSKDIRNNFKMWIQYTPKNMARLKKRYTNVSSVL
jgi:hypothetical protein